MIKNQQSDKSLVKLIAELNQLLGCKYQEWITATVIAIIVIILRSLGLLQPLELGTLDQLFNLRPTEGIEERITIVEIDEASLREVGSWPIPDRAIAQLLQKLQEQQPRAIGLDIYRDLPVNPGYQELVNVYNSIPNLIGIELLANNKNTSVSPPPVLDQIGKVGFSNVLYDLDGKVRRSLLYLHTENQVHESFALKLALLYLKSEGITPQTAASNPEYLQLGKAVFTRFEKNNGGYVDADDRGYQILSNFPKPHCDHSSITLCCYRHVSLNDVLANQVPKDWINDRIILIGSTAASVQDFVFVPYSSSLIGRIKPIAGVQLQAYFIHELIASALQGRPLLKVWPDLIENLWIFLWSYLGIMIICRFRYVKRSAVIVVICACFLSLTAYVAFLAGWWIPIVPAGFSFGASAIAITCYLAYIQAELKRSKEFLYQVINAIPDPIFVKNAQNQWIVLNEAYCKFIGYPHNLLMQKSEYELFSQHEADVFREQDELVFRTHQSQEHEEEFTDIHGKKHLIATKRSLHKDAAGNLFLIGVIRDITQRKQVEEELKRTATELYRFNHELRLQEVHLRQMAYYDPLTGLSNRKFFVENLCESLLWAQNNNLLLGLLFIDLDGFKQVNDTLGHEMGDRLLVIIAQRLKNCLRASDTVSRLGGDEFTVILPAIAQVQVAAQVANKLLSIITEPIVLDGNTTSVSASIGISIYPIDSQDCETLIKQADLAMYSAKNLGKNRYEFV